MGVRSTVPKYSTGRLIKKRGQRHAVLTGRPRQQKAAEGCPNRAQLYPNNSFSIVPIRTDNCATFFILFMVGYDNLKFTLLISAGSRIDANHASGLDEALPGLWTTEDRRVLTGGSNSNRHELGKINSSASFEDPRSMGHGLATAETF